MSGKEPKPLRVLELGNYVVPAYAGMILAEQGAKVYKWTKPGTDPILTCHHGDRLWAWINEGKYITDIHPEQVASVARAYDIIIDNFRPQTLDRWSINPQRIAEENRVVWVSMRSDVPSSHSGRSFDIIAQARSTMEFAPWAPYWIGDTAGGLWLAFKALAMHTAGRIGHHTIEQAGTLQKLVEGELTLSDIDRDDKVVPWEPETYEAGPEGVTVRYRGETITEPIRDRHWKLRHLRHRGGRIVI
jgi:crotonobetainyl-CoA:carnitine CoA-transferase CaiB-like acyl-CoA transferase